MAGSGALDIYLSFLEDGSNKAPPLFFHHVPKTAGTSFRAAVERALLSSSKITIADVKDVVQARGTWPQGIVDLYRRVADLAPVTAALSHYTSLLANEVPYPILSLVRDPDEQFRSAIEFRAGSYNALKPIRILTRSSNQQMRSLSGLMDHKSIPVRMPDDKREMRRWLRLVDRVVGRMTLFRMADLPALLEFCRQEYGLALDELHKKRRTQARPMMDTALMDEVERLAGEHDPVWLDRILYERVAKR